MTRLSRLVWIVPLVTLLGQPAPSSAGDDPFPRRQRLTADDLRKQLAAVPVVRPLSFATMNGLLRKRLDDLEGGSVTGPLTEPARLVGLRPDLRALPLRGGAASLRDPASAKLLGQLAKKLRDRIESSAPKGPNGKRIGPDLLEEVLRKQRDGKRPEWVREEAIPTLQQLLMGEEDRLRMVLVDLLADIPGRAATQALAQRAVFDPAPEVRAAAIKALRERSATDWRPVLLRGLRYPWPAAADHAAEALAALGDKESVARLIVMLKAPDPAAPFAGRDGSLYVREMVRIEHAANCMMCHPLADLPGTESTPNLVPGAIPRTSFMVSGPDLRDPKKFKPAPPPSLVPVSPGNSLVFAMGPTQPYYGPGAPARIGTSTTFLPAVVRGEVTYIRQDFSAEVPTTPFGPSVRFDFVVRTRRLSPGTGPKDKPKADYPQRDSVLFALRHLTGEDCGKDAAAWLAKFPRAEFDARAEQIGEELVRASAANRPAVLRRLKESKGVLYTHALAYAIPRLSGQPQRDARAALAERLTRMKPATLKEDLACDEPEVQRAAARAAALRGLKELLPDLQALAQDDDPDVAQEAAKAVDLLK